MAITEEQAQTTEVSLLVASLVFATHTLQHLLQMHSCDIFV